MVDDGNNPRPVACRKSNGFRLLEILNNSLHKVVVLRAMRSLARCPQDDERATLQTMHIGLSLANVLTNIMPI